MKVKVRNTQFNRPGIWMFEQPEFFEFEGEEIQVKWLKPGELALSTGNPEFPFRVIQRNLIDTIDGSVVKYTDSAVKTFTVKGSKGDHYTVTVGGNRVHCTCSGFQFRKTCKHVKETENV
jgi:hypothetical protein